MKASIRKYILLKCFILLFPLCLSASPRQGQDLILPGHWVYDALHHLELETKTLTFSDIAPLSIQEFKSYFSMIDYEKLSEPGKKEYERIESFLSERKLSLDAGIFSACFEPVLNPEFYLSSDMDKTKETAIPYMYDYTKRKALIDLPVSLALGDYLSVYMGLQVKQTRLAMEEPATFFNDVFGLTRFDLVLTHDNYLSAGYKWDNGVGINLRFGINSQVFGYTSLPSVVWSEYLTDTPNINLRVYSPFLCYNFNITEFTRDSYLYTHQFDLRFWKFFEISFIEGVFAYNTFDLRFANPFAIYHGLGLFKIYDNEVKVNSLFSLKANIVPVENMRIYLLWTQNEHQMGSELSDPSAAQTPEGFGAQAGIEYNIPLKKGYLHLGTEAYYASPFLYIKDSPMLSFAKVYTENLTDASNHYYQWLGSPLGPDSLAFQVSAGYEEPGKWALDLIYNFQAKGEFGGDYALKNSGWNYYTNTISDTPEKIWPYYYDNKRNYITPTGIPEYVNAITIRGSVCPVYWLTVTAQPSYIFVNNFNHEAGNNRQGFQFALSTRIDLTKVFVQNKLLKN